MGILRESAGRSAPLDEAGVLDVEQLRRLRALSVTTVDELIGLIRADAAAVAAFTGIEDLAGLQADAASMASQAVFETADRMGQLPMAMGAKPPPDGQIEEVVSLATFEDYSSEALSSFADERQGGGGPPSDLRVDLRHLFGAVRDQADRGTCVGHACAAVFEGLDAAARGSSRSFSPQYVFWQSKQRDGSPESDGTWGEVAIHTLVGPGICEEELWPYEGDVRPGDLTHGPPPAAADTNAGSRQASGAHVLGRRASQDVRDALDAGRPVSLSVPVYRNWRDNPATALTGLIPMPLPLSELEGGHAMCAVGYGYDADDIAGGWFFLLRNSWSTAWASASPIEAGYGIIPFLYIDRYGWEAVSAVG